jgi:hypothetical protein
LARIFERSFKRASFLERVDVSISEYRLVEGLLAGFAEAVLNGLATAPLRAAFSALVWRGLEIGVEADDFFARGLPALADAALRAFPGAVVRGCRDIEMHTNRDDKRVSGMASNGPGR